MAQPFRTALGALSICLLLSAAPALADTQSLVILHDNDLHGHLRSFCYIEVGRGPQEHCGVGGAARRATLIRSLRAQAKAPMMLIDTGDTTTRGPLATEYEGLDEADAMNALGYDLAVVGNNEFKLKDDADAHDSAGAQADMLRLFHHTRFVWVAANVTDAQGALLQGVQPYVVRKVGGVRIAFLGLTTLKSQHYTQTKGLTFADPVAAANAWIPKARAEADVVIAVTHLGVDGDQRLVAQTRGLDAVIGGDSHTFLYKPLEVKNLDGKIVPVVQDGEFGANLGEFRLTFTGDAHAGWHLAAWHDRLVPVNAALKPDPAVAALVKGYAKPLDAPLGSVAKIGTTPPERTRLTGEAVAAALKASAGADVGLIPQGSLYESFRTHTVTRYEVRAVLPFRDTVWKGPIDGAALKTILQYHAPDGGGVFATIRADDVDPAKTYTVATPAYVAHAQKLAGQDTGVEYRQAVEAWLGGGPR